MSLYQKPGYASSEWRLTLGILAACLILLVVGAVIALKVDHQLGEVFIASGAVMASVTGAAYAHGRSKVKAAAESARPPPSRVV